MVDYAPFVETQLTIDYMREHRQQRPDQPFAIVLGWGASSLESVEQQAYYGEYPQEYDIYDPEEVDLPGNVPVQLVDFERKELADYYAMVTTLDACMGRWASRRTRPVLASATIPLSCLLRPRRPPGRTRHGQAVRRGCTIPYAAPRRPLRGFACPLRRIIRARCRATRARTRC